MANTSQTRPPSRQQNDRSILETIVLSVGQNTRPAVIRPIYLKSSADVIQPKELLALALLVLIRLVVTTENLQWGRDQGWGMDDV